MWALVVVAVHEIIELGLLLQEVLRCGLSRFFLHRPLVAERAIDGPLPNGWNRGALQTREEIP